MRLQKSLDLRQKILSLFRNQSKFLQASWLGIGNSFGSIINILLMVVLSRFLLKEEYGTFRQVIYLHAILISVVGISLSKVASNYLPLLTLAQGRNLVSRILTSLLGIGAFFTLALVLANPLICEFFNNPELERPLYLFSGIIFFVVPTLGIEGIYTSYKKTQVFGIYTIVNKLLMFVFLIMPLFVYASELYTVILFWLVQSSISFLIGIYLIYRPFSKVESEESNVTFTTIYRFIWPLVISSLLGILFTASDQYFISNYFGKEVYADFSNGSIQIPFIGFLIASIGSILHPYFIEKINSEEGKSEIVSTIKNSISKSVVLSYPIILFIWFMSDEIFSILFEEIYSNSSNFFKIISLYNLFSVFVFLPIIIVLNEVKFYNVVHIIAVALVWGGQYAVLQYFENPLAVPLVSLVVKGMIIVVFVIKVTQRLGVSYSRMIPSREIIFLILTCAIALTPLYFGRRFFDTEGLIGTIFYMIIGFITYYLLVVAINKNFRQQLKTIVGQFL